MRAFFQKKAGATYFQKCNFTISIRKSEIEFIYALEKGWHAVINVIINPDDVTLLIVLPDFATKLDDSLSQLTFRPGEMSKFSALLQGKSDYRILDIEPDGKDQACGIGLTIPNQIKNPFNVIGDTEIYKAGGKLVNYALSLYHELSHSDKAPLKSLTDCFYD